MANKTPKTPNPSNLLKKQPRIVPAHSEKQPNTEEEVIVSWIGRKIDEQKAGEMVMSLLEWPTKFPNARFISEFYDIYHLHEKQYERLCKKYEKLGEAHARAMQKLIERKLAKAEDASPKEMALFQLPFHGEKYKKWLEYHDERKTKMMKEAPQSAVFEIIGRAAKGENK